MGDVVRGVPSGDLGPREVAALRDLLDAAWAKLDKTQQVLLSLRAEGYGLAEIAAIDHPNVCGLLDFSRAEVRRIEDFCRANDVIGLPEEPMMITWTPVFMRAYGRAFLHSPGPLDKGQRSYFWITPPDEAAGP